MGFLTVDSKALDWKDTEAIQALIKKFGIRQLVNLFNKFKDTQKTAEELCWGDELEYHVVKLKDDQKKAQIWADGYRTVSAKHADDPVEGFDYHHEFGSWMAEAVPKEPYHLADFKEPLNAFQSLIKRRNDMNKRMEKEQLYFLSMPSFPTLGDGAFFDSEHKEVADLAHLENKADRNHSSKSLYVVDELINSHNRFHTLVRNIRERRGDKVDIRVPLFRDEQTPPHEQDIHMDSMHFGMGMCSLQVTFECQNLDHGRYLHDALLPFTPILAAMSAASPIHKGRLADWDLRWKIIEQSTDSRRADEVHTGRHPKPRYSTMSHYISDHPYFSHPGLEDVPQTTDGKEYEAELIEAGMPPTLAAHFASKFAHDALVIFEERLAYLEDSTEHFEQF